MATLTILAVGRVVGGQVHLRVAPPVIHSDTQLAAVSYGRRLFNDGAARTACIGIHELAGWDEACAEVDALVDEMFAKPNLGIMDSAGQIDARTYFGFDDDTPLGFVFTPDDGDDKYDIGEDESRHPFYY